MDVEQNRRRPFEAHPDTFTSLQYNRRALYAGRREGNAHFQLRKRSLYFVHHHFPTSLHEGHKIRLISFVRWRKVIASATCITATNIS